MTNENLYALVEAYADYYWSAPVRYVAAQIKARHPEVTDKQFRGALINGPRRHHYDVVKDGLEEPEIVIEHLIAVDPNDLDRFVAARLDVPYCDCDEETMLLYRREGLRNLDIPEVKAIQAFGRQELGLDDAWEVQLLDDCALNQPYALLEDDSWVMKVLKQEKFGKIRFKTIDQVKRFRDLGNALYWALPNPVLRGWRPCDLEKSPVPKDDIPEKDEDIPDNRAELNRIVQALKESTHMPELSDESPEYVWQPPKPRRNDPCPCGSGKKYKNCCGANR